MLFIETYIKLNERIPPVQDGSSEFIIDGAEYGSAATVCWLLGLNWKKAFIETRDYLNYKETPLSSLFLYKGSLSK